MSFIIQTALQYKPQLITIILDSLEFEKTCHTSQNSFNKWTKISSLEIIIFELKNDGKKWSRIYFEIDQAPSEIPAKLPGQFGHSGQQQL